MRIKPRNMKKYTPRRRRFSKTLQKQQIEDLKHLLDMDLSSYLILHEEGSPKQAEQARLKLRTDILKYGSDMDSIARDLGEGYPAVIGDFIKNMMQIAQGIIDPKLLNEHRTFLITLEKMSKRQY